MRFLSKPDPKSPEEEAFEKAFVEKEEEDDRDDGSGGYSEPCGGG